MSSHDPREDTSSLSILACIAVLGVICIIGFIVSPGRNESAEPGLIYVVDGCRVYKFLDEGETHYFATCENGVTATTYANGTKHIPAEQL